MTRNHPFEGYGESNIGDGAFLFDCKFTWEPWLPTRRLSASLPNKHEIPDPIFSAPSKKRVQTQTEGTGLRKGGTESSGVAGSGRSVQPRTAVDPLPHPKMCNMPPVHARPDHLHFPEGAVALLILPLRQGTNLKNSLPAFGTAGNGWVGGAQLP